MALHGLMDNSRYAARSTLARLRAVRPTSWLKVGACAAVLAVVAGALALRHESPHRERRPAAAHARPAAVMSDAARPVSHGAPAPPVEGKGNFKGKAQTYATAARKGDARGLKKLIAMTRADKCEVRSEAADALATLPSKKATAALQKLSHARFKDESRSPGIFSCSSRRAAQKALENRGRG